MSKLKNLDGETVVRRAEDSFVAGFKSTNEVREALEKQSP